MKKILAMAALYEDALKSVSSGGTKWAEFLKTAAANYKYSFMDQLMIYAQRPDASACASFKVWTDTLKRGIHKGSKGIALLRDVGDSFKLEYVYDVSDTYRRQGQDIRLWQFRMETEDAVIEELENSFGGLKVNTTIVDAVICSAHNAVRKEMPDLSQKYLSSAEASVIYMLLSRMELSPDNIIVTDGLTVPSDPEELSGFGSKVSSVAQNILRTVEKTVKRKEKENVYGNGLQGSERNVYPQSGSYVSSDGEAHRPVRETVHGTLNGEQKDGTDGSAAEREAFGASGNSERNSRTDGGADNSENGRTGRDGRSTEAAQSPEMGGADEQLQAFGGGSGTSGDSVQLSFLDTVPAAEYQEHIGEAEQTSFAFSVPQQVIDEVLCDGTNEENSVLEICIEFSKNKPMEEKAAFLQKLYDTDGKGFILDGVKVSAWWDEAGIRIAFGGSAQAERATLLSWEAASERIDALLDLGRYAPKDVLLQMKDYEYQKTAETFWYMKQDLNYEVYPELNTLFEAEVFGSREGFPKETARIAAHLQTAEGLDETKRITEKLCELYSENSDIMRSRFHNPPEADAAIGDLYLPRKEYTAESLSRTSPERFISEDEINNILSRGSNISESKYRIYRFFDGNSDKAKRIKFLKDEYGMGGSYNGKFYEKHDGKGIEYGHDGISAPYAKTLIKWEQAERRINSLIINGKYLNPKELEHVSRHKTEQEIPQISGSNDVRSEYAAIKEAHSSDIVLFQVGDFFEMYGEDAKIAADVLDIHLAQREIKNIGKVDFCGIPAFTLEANIEKLRDKYDVTISAIDSNTGKRGIYTLLSVDREAERNIDAYETEPSFTHIETSLAKHKPTVIAAVTDDMLYRNACLNADRENAVIEGNAAVRRAVLNSGDVELIRLYSDVPEFRIQLHTEVVDETYPLLHEQELRKHFILGINKFIYNSENESIVWTYYNPDGNDSKGQIVETVLYPYDIREAFKAKSGENGDERFLEQLYTLGRTTLYDYGTLEFEHSSERLLNEKADLALLSDDGDIKGENLRRLADFMEEKYPSFIQTETDILRVYTTNFVSAVLRDSEYLQSTESSDTGLIRRECENAVNRAAAKLPTDEEHESFHVLFSDNMDFRQRLYDNVFKSAYTDMMKNVEKTFAGTERTSNRKTAEERNYYFLSDLAPEIISGETRYIRFEAGESFMPLTIERLSEDRISVSHFYVQNGDVMYDPDMEFIIDKENMALTPQTYRQDGLAVYQSVENGSTTVKELNTFAGQWFSNIRSQGYVKKREIKEINGEDVELNYSETPDIIGKELMIGDRKYVVDSISGEDAVLKDITFQNGTGFPIFRSESVEWLKRVVDLQKHDSKPFTEKTTAIYHAEENNLPYDIVVNTISTDTLTSERRNFRITNDELGYGGQKEKFRMNMEAISVLKQCESENRFATPEEQEILSRYVGWGGLPEAFDSSKENWSKEYTELKELLTVEEYEQARASTLDAHYTPPTIIKAMYKTIENMGFSKGNILEPSMGVGNFFGMLPESMSQSNLYGVELDSITGKIAKQLYPKADITVAGFETTDRRDFYDLAVGNVPFGQYQVSDKAYNKLGFPIHDYFIAKAIDQVRPGGVIAFVTSRYTMDKQSPEARQYFAKRAELLGAIRLPNTAFKANAGTSVVSDIIFLQKRESPIEIEPDWLHLGVNKDGFSINSYFINNPDMILGHQTSKSTQYGKDDFTVVPYEGVTLEEQLKEAIKNIHGTYIEAEIGEDIDEQDNNPIPADPDARNYSYTIYNEKIYYKETDKMYPADIPKSSEERVKGMIEVRDIVRSVIAAQLEGESDEVVQELQEKLNNTYDRFADRFGRINDKINKRAFSRDDGYYLIASIENFDSKGNFAGKGQIFNERTIRPKTVVTHVDTASEALALSYAEKARVDMDYMSALTGKSETELYSELKGEIFLNPKTGLGANGNKYLVRSEYLSGNVREKLEFASKAAELYSEEYSINVSALEAVQPERLTAEDIIVRLGSTWVPTDIITEFCREIAKPSFWQEDKIYAQYSKESGNWNVNGKSIISNVHTDKTYGTNYKNALEIIEDTLNLKDVKIYKTITENGKEKRVINHEATILTQQKQRDIRNKFEEWIWMNPDRRKRLEDIYNEKFNSIRSREYDGSNLILSGINSEIALRPNQLVAAARVIYGGNTLIAHSVGAGKTFTMIAAAMESKRLGLCSKSLFVVPNHIVDQWAKDFLRLYPSANILAVTEKDFEKSARKKFCGRIAANNYDAVIIGHSQFEKIPMSQEYQEKHLERQIFDITEAITNSNSADRWSVKQLELTKKRLTEKLKKLTETGTKDDVIKFEELGIDRIFVDESDEFKNLYLYTKMRNIAGIAQTEAQKSNDLFMKCRYLDEITGGRGVIFATGTPISNSMTELYTIQRYLQYDVLNESGLINFDDWASTFGETVTAMELNPEGTGQRFRTRFAKFNNLPELMTMFKEVADIQTADMLNLPVPEAEFITEISKPSDLQKKIVKSFGMRADRIRKGDPMKFTRDGDISIEDNMLLVTNDGRKLALDQRLINPLAPDDSQSKVNLCAQRVFNHWSDGMDERLTQLVFCDISTPDKSNFNVYDDLKEKLIKMGIPPEEIAYIHSAKTKAAKEELFAKVRSGEVRVLIGSTQKMGAGTNVQERLIAIHDLDCPWRPRDLEQRAGRVIRQGNRNKKVYIHRYVTEGTFDAYLYQIIENKQKFISQIMTGKVPARSASDVDETVLSYAEIKALATGNPLIKEKMELETEIQRLKLLKNGFVLQKSAIAQNLKIGYPKKIEYHKKYIEDYEADIKTRNAETKPDFEITLEGIVYRNKEKAGKAIIELCRKYNSSTHIGSYRGFSLKIEPSLFFGEYSYAMILLGKQAHKTELGSSPIGNITRMDNVLNDFENVIVKHNEKISETESDIAAAKELLTKEWEHKDELEAMEIRLAEIDTKLNLDAENPEEKAFYETVQELFSPIVEGTPYIEMGKFMLESMGGSIFSIAHYERQGDFYGKEPCFSFEFLKETNEIHILEYFVDSEEIRYSLLDDRIETNLGGLSEQDLPGLFKKLIEEVCAAQDAAEDLEMEV